MNAAAYARYSSDNQREESIDAQLRAIREYAAREGYTIVQDYIDEARSATTDNRPAFQRMMTDSAAGGFQAVVVHKLDRFSRDRYDSAYYKRLLKKNGVRLISVLEHLDGSPESIIMESVLEGMAEYYSRNLAREVRKGMNENALKAKHNGGIAPLGYDVAEDKSYAVNEAEAATVRRIFDLYAQGNGYGAIIEQLNAEGRRTKLGRPFGKNSIAEILRNEKYIGRYVYNKRESKKSNRKYKPDDQITRIDGAFPAIVDRAVWGKVQQILSGRKHMPRQGGDRVYILSGKLVCGECGAAYVGAGYVGGRGGKRYYQYQCTNVRQKKCSNRSVRQDAIEQYVIEEIRTHVLSERQIEKISRIISDEKKKQETQKGKVLPELRRRAGDLEEKIGKLLDLFLSTGIDKSILNARIAPMQDELGAIKHDIAAYEQIEGSQGVRDLVKKYLHAQKKSLENADTEALQRAVDAFVERVLVYKDHFEIVIRVLADSDNNGGGEGS